MQRQYIVKVIGNVSDWLSYAGGARPATIFLSKSLRFLKM